MSVVTGHATIEKARAFIVNHIQSYAMYGKSRDGWSMTGFPCGTEEGDAAHFKEVVARVRNVNEGKYDHMSILDALSTLTNPSTKATAPEIDPVLTLEKGDKVLFVDEGGGSGVVHETFEGGFLVRWADGEESSHLDGDRRVTRLQSEVP